MDGHNEERRKLGQSVQKPADIFDLIGGTSTGGLIAIMLGRLQMDVDECISAYNNLIKVVFHEKARVHQSKFSLRGQTRARFDSKGLKAAIEKTLRDRGLPTTDTMVDSGEPDCRVFVCATSKLNAAVYRFRSYNSQKTSLNASICQVARATAAAPTFFDDVSIGGMKFVDGALGANNPVDQVEEDAMEIWCPKTGNLQPLVKCFISIGTGSLPAYNIHDRVDKFVNALAKMATDAERTAEGSIKRWRQHFEQGRYFRFNVDRGLQTVGMKEYRKKGEIKAATDLYLDSQAQSVLVKKCIGNLILKKKSTGLDFELRIAKQQDFLSPSSVCETPEKPPEPQSQFNKAKKKKSAPQPYFDIPTKLSHPSIDRPSYLKKLQAAFSQDFYRRAALVGLGGSGKTQIAIQFAEWVHTVYPDYSIFWVSGYNLKKSYLQIAQKLDLFERYRDEVKTTNARVLVHRYLSTESLQRWFLIIDDADYSKNLLGPGAKPGIVFNDIPSSKEGRVLLITHSMKAATAAVGNQASQIIKVGGLASPDAVSIFGQSLVNKKLLQDEDKVLELLSELSGSPMSLKQAASYLNNHSQLTTDKFLESLRSPRQDAFPFISQEYGSMGDEKASRDPIFKTIIKSFEAVLEENPFTATMLEFISRIEPSSIPCTILPDAGVKDERNKLEEAIGTLCSYFLLVPQNGGDMFDMPTIVHLSARLWVQQNQDSNGLTKTATKRLDRLVPSVNWSKRLEWKKYKSHALRVLVECQDLGLQFPERFQLACKVGSWLLHERDSKDAIPWLQQALGWAKKSSIKNPQRRLRIQLDLAEAYAETEQFNKAVQLAERALAFQEKHLSNDDASLLAVSCTLAKSRRLSGVPKLEIDRLETLRNVDCKRSAENKLALLGELGKCYNCAEDYGKAVETLKMGIDAAERQIAKDDPILLAVKNNLAYAYGQTDQRNKAIFLLEETLPVQKQTLGKLHHIILTNQEYLGDQYLEIKDLTKAISLLEELLPIQRKTFGPVHKKTMSSENDLAEAYLENNNVYTALKLYEHMVSVRQKDLGQGDEQRTWAEAGYNKCIKLWSWTWARR
ncbi:calcium-independent phospholipase A2 [Fusarium beomiforme]|uniref:Calcium-independent phospholipase A2 n=1 Tax=Fusarium beomiforme TaxID=44412 RepID=A0A9P5AGB9_9HYPO|nr:calcium-independent phospholipase A2 [Fusarium beomiforme]